MNEVDEHLGQTYSDNSGEYAVKDIVNYAYKKQLQNFSVDELAEIAFQHSSDEDFDEVPGSPAFVARAEKSDLKYPIVVIQYPDGKFIADGNHRLWKAKSLGMKAIKGYRITPQELHKLPKVKQELKEMKIKVEHIVKQGSQYCLKSKKSNKNLGCYPSHGGAEKREKQVQYFKHLGETLNEDEVDNMPDNLSEREEIDNASAFTTTPMDNANEGAGRGVDTQDSDINVMQEMSGAGGGVGIGSIEGAPGQIDRKKFLEELKLRKFIKEKIKTHQKEEFERKLASIKEEQKLRSIVRKLIKEAEEEKPHQSTGINVLSDLLKKIVPIIEIDYKKLTSKPEQRQSFRAHMLKAAQHVLETEEQNDTAGDGQQQSQAGQMKEEDNGEAAINLDVTPDEPVDPEAHKFIDVDRPSQKKAKAKEPDPVDTFGIEGEDVTGRNIAMSSFQKIEKSITDAYSILSDPEDKRLFYDYLITNLKLYFDKFEDELKTNVNEPTNDTYEQEKGKQQQGGSDQGLGMGL